MLSKWLKIYTRCFWNHKTTSDLQCQVHCFWKSTDSFWCSKCEVTLSFQFLFADNFQPWGTRLFFLVEFYKIMRWWRIVFFWDVKDIFLWNKFHKTFIELWENNIYLHTFIAGNLTECKPYTRSKFQVASVVSSYNKSSKSKSSAKGSELDSVIDCRFVVASSANSKMSSR